MYISDGIAYAGEQEPVIKVCGVRPLAGHKLWLLLHNWRGKDIRFYTAAKRARICTAGR